MCNDAWCMTTAPWISEIVSGQVGAELDLVPKSEREERQVRTLLAQLEAAPRPLVAAHDATGAQGEASTSAPAALPAQRTRSGRAAAGGRAPRRAAGPGRGVPGASRFASISSANGGPERRNGAHASAPAQTPSNGQDAQAAPAKAAQPGEQTPGARPAGDAANGTSEQAGGGGVLPAGSAALPLPSLGAPLPGVVGQDLVAAGMATAAAREAPGPEHAAAEQRVAASPSGQQSAATPGGDISQQSPIAELKLPQQAVANGYVSAASAALTGDAKLGGVGESSAAARARVRAAAAKARRAAAAEARASEARRERARTLPARLSAMALSRPAAAYSSAPLRVQPARSSGAQGAAEARASAAKPTAAAARAASPEAAEQAQTASGVEVGRDQVVVEDSPVALLQGSMGARQEGIAWEAFHCAGKERTQPPTAPPEPAGPVRASAGAGQDAAATPASREQGHGEPRGGGVADRGGRAVRHPLRRSMRSRLRDSRDPAHLQRQAGITQAGAQEAAAPAARRGSWRHRHSAGSAADRHGAAGEQLESANAGLPAPAYEQGKGLFWGMLQPRGAAKGRAQAPTSGHAAGPAADAAAVSPSAAPAEPRAAGTAQPGTDRSGAAEARAATRFEPGQQPALDMGTAAKHAAAADAKREGRAATVARAQARASQRVAGGAGVGSAQPAGSPSQVGRAVPRVQPVTSASLRVPAGALEAAPGKGQAGEAAVGGEGQGATDAAARDRSSSPGQGAGGTRSRSAAQAGMQAQAEAGDANPAWVQPARAHRTPEAGRESAGPSAAPADSEALALLQAGPQPEQAAAPAPDVSAAGASEQGTAVRTAGGEPALELGAPGKAERPAQAAGRQATPAEPAPVQAAAPTVVPPAVSLPDVAAPALPTPSSAPQAAGPQAVEAGRVAKAKAPRHAPATDARYGAVESGEPRYKPRSPSGARPPRPRSFLHQSLTGDARLAYAQGCCGQRCQGVVHACMPKAHA